MKQLRAALLAMIVVMLLAISMAGASLAQGKAAPVLVREVFVPVRSAVPLYLANGTAIANTHEVVGRATGLSPMTVSLTGLAKFSNSLSYFCVATGADNVQTLGPQVVNLDGAHFQIVHASADPATVTYRCVGM